MQMKPVHIGYMNYLKVLQLTKIYDVDMKFWKQLTKIQRKRVIDFINIHIDIEKQEDNGFDVEVNEELLDLILEKYDKGEPLLYSENYNLITLGNSIHSAMISEIYHCRECGEPFECSIERHITEDHYETLLRDD